MKGAFSQSRVTKAIAGAARAGWSPGEIVIAPDGSIRLLRQPTALDRDAAAQEELEKHFGAKKVR